MYRRPKFLEVLHAIREEMSREADYDVDLLLRWCAPDQPSHGPKRIIRGFKTAHRAQKAAGKSASLDESNRNSAQGAGRR